MKRAPIFLLSLVLLAIWASPAEAQLKEALAPNSTRADTTQHISVACLLSPAFQSFGEAKFSSFSQASNTKLIHFNGTAKFLLRAATDLIRGKREEYSMYSFENAWKYPGRTVKYPKTATEYELFVERYQRYTSEN